MKYQRIAVPALELANWPGTHLYAPRMADKTHYGILMVEAGADTGIITMVHHAPVAYTVLSDSKSRERYDESIEAILRRHVPA